MSQNDIILNSPSLYKAVLERGDDIRENGFKAINKNLGGKFVDGVAKANGSEITNMKRVVNLRDKGDEGVVDFFQNFPSIEETEG